MRPTWRTAALTILIAAPALTGREARSQTYRPDRGAWTYDRGGEAAGRPRVDPLDSFRRPERRFEYDPRLDRSTYPADRDPVPPPPPPRVYRDAYRPTYDARRPAPGYDVSRRVLGLADDLQVQVDSFTRDFARTAHVVPEGAQFLAEARALSASVDRFRRAAAGSDLSTLSGELQMLEDAWTRLATRTERVAKGRTGPNIERTYAMGDTLGRIRQAIP